MFFEFLNTFKQNTHYTLLTNQFTGLARGPIDHNASSVINVIANGAITMGDALILSTTTPTAELLPRVQTSTAAVDLDIYGIAVGGDTDGIYGNGTVASDDTTRATASAGQGVVVVTQGRCLARVKGANQAGDTAVAIGDPLVSSDDDAGTLFVGTAADTNEVVVARALQVIVSGELDIIAVDVQREGVGVQ